MRFTNADSNISIYYRKFLTPRQKHEYNRILAAVRQREPSICFAVPINELSAMCVLYAVLGDNHELFWLDVNWSFCRVKFYGKVLPLIRELKFNYLGNREEQQSDMWEIYRIADEVVEQASVFPTQLEQARFVFRWLSSHVSYINQDVSPHSQTIKGALLDRATACAGFSHAMAWICTKLGIECRYIWGRLDGTPHAWNHLVVDGCGIYCDIASSLVEERTGIWQPTELFFAMSRKDLERFGYRFDFPEIAPEAPDSACCQWDLSGGYRGKYDFDRCLWAIAAAVQSGRERICFSFTDGTFKGFHHDFLGNGSDGIEAVAAMCGKQMSYDADFFGDFGVVELRFA